MAGVDEDRHEEVLSGPGQPVRDGEDEGGSAEGSSEDAWGEVLASTT